MLVTSLSVHEQQSEETGELISSQGIISHS